MVYSQHVVSRCLSCFCSLEQFLSAKHTTNNRPSPFPEHSLPSPPLPPTLTSSLPSSSQLFLSSFPSPLPSPTHLLSSLSHSLPFLPSFLPYPTFPSQNLFSLPPLQPKIPHYNFLVVVISIKFSQPPKIQLHTRWLKHCAFGPFAFNNNIFYEYGRETYILHN